MVTKPGQLHSDDWPEEMHTQSTAVISVVRLRLTDVPPSFRNLQDSLQVQTAVRQEQTCIGSLVAKGLIQAKLLAVTIQVWIETYLCLTETITEIPVKSPS